MNASVDDVKEFVGETREAALALAASHFRTTEDQLESWVIPPDFHVSGLGERVLLIAAPRGAERAARPQEARRDERRGPDRERGRDRDRDRGDRGDRERGGRERSESRAAPRERVTPRVERETPREPEPAEVTHSSGPVGQVGSFIAGILERMKLRDVNISEAETEDGEIVVTLSGSSITSLADREPRLVAALSHLAHRAAEALLDEDDAAAQVEIRGVRRAPREDSRERGGRDGRRDGRQEGRGERERGGRGRDPEDRDIDEGELERLARDAARAVRESGEPELLPPMNSRERWFIHNALKDERGVRSESEGEGARKRVRILPA